MPLLVLALCAVTALAHAAPRGPDGDHRRVDWRADDGIEIAQGVALAAFGIFATMAILAVIESLGINLVQALFQQIMP